MQKLLKPFWIVASHTFPVVILFFLYANQYTIIKTLLSEKNVFYWLVFGIGLGVLALAGGLYAAYLQYRRQPVSLTYAVLALILNIIFIYSFMANSHEIIPVSIPMWMLFPNNLIILVFTFLMPSLVYSLLVIIIHITPPGEKKKALPDFLKAIVIPFVYYFFFQIMVPLMNIPGSHAYFIHVMVIVSVIFFILFFLFLIRAIYILTVNKSHVLSKYDYLWRILVAIILPLIGLTLNNGGMPGFANFSEDDGVGIFGDFSNRWFYILALLNGIFLCLPATENMRYRLSLFIARSVTFPFTLYFFIVFLPLLPFSLPAVFVYGTGLLVMAPVILFVLHVNALSQDYKFLKDLVSERVLRPLFVSNVVIIPVILFFSFLQDRKVLDEALEYMYYPNYSKEYSIDRSSLENTLSVVKQLKQRQGFLISSVPYITSLYNWLVLDNLTLSDYRINHIERVFFGEEKKDSGPLPGGSDVVGISDVSVTSFFDQEQNAWISWVDLTIRNNDAQALMEEYATVFELPVGCWIADYYLYVGEKKEAGVLAERRSALWVYRQIRDVRRDPGILYYLNGRRVAFRVFPFAGGEVRQTGIQFIHHQPVTLNIDGHEIALGHDRAKVQPETVSVGNVYFIPAERKKELPLVQRKPYFHFLVDVSAQKDELKEDFISRIHSLVTKWPDLAADARMSFVNSTVATVPFDQEWISRYHQQRFDGGFFLDRAIRKALWDAHRKKNAGYPVLVVVTDSLEKAVLDDDYSEMKPAFPESDLFFVLDANHALHAHSLVHQPRSAVATSPAAGAFEYQVREYRFPDGTVTYLADNDEPEIFLQHDTFEVDTTKIREKNWYAGLLLQGKLISHAFHPELEEAEWLDMVRFSFLTKLMLPLTSYIVVENEAQKEVLMRKQQQVLAGNKALDLTENPRGMSEPGMLSLALFLLALLLLLRTIKRQRKAA